jgi:NIPSNAP
MLEGMKVSHLASFAMGIMVMLGISMLTQTHAQTPGHVFEYRKYYANPGKLDDLKARFRDHTITIFNKHNMKSVGYWIPEDNKDNAIVYILEHPSKEEGLKNWTAFSADPEWQKASKASEVNGKLVDHVDRVWMDPTDFSPIK